VVVLMLVVLSFVEFAGVMFFAVLVVGSLGVSFMLVLLFAFVGFGGATLGNGLTRQNFGSDGRGSLRRAVAVRIAVTMAVIVVLEIFENVADVQKGVAVETDIDEGGLHTGEDAGDAAFVD